MKKILYLMLLFLFAGNTAMHLNAQITYCNDFGQTLSDNSRGWSLANFTVLGTTKSIDVKIEGDAIIRAGDLYRGVANASNVIDVVQDKDVTILLDKGTASFNWIHFAAYADWNGDLTFNPATERVVYDFNNSNVNRTYTIKVPATAALGETRIRIIMGWFTQDTDPAQENYVSPCFMVGSSGADNKVPKNGRVFDFLLNVMAPGADVAKAELLAKITEANTLKAGTTEGTGVFEYTTASRSTLQSAIDAAQTIYDNASATIQEVEDATSTLNMAIYNYRASQIMPFKPSNETDTYWYQIHDKRSPFVYWNIATVGTTAHALGRTTTSDASAQSQLFKFVKAPYPNAGYYIYSKINDVNALASPTTNNGDIIRIESSTPMSFRFQNAQTGYYLIITENTNRQLNSYTDKISFWDGGASDPGNNWMFVEKNIIPARTVTVSSADVNMGSVAIEGISETSVTNDQIVNVKAIPLPGFIFTKWTNAVTDADVSAESLFAYAGTADIQLKANFVTLGTVGIPRMSNDVAPIYYYIQSASDGSHSFNSYTGDFRNNVMISPATAGKIIHNKLSAATTSDHALWQIVNVSEVTLLKNKATGWFMVGSHSVGASGSAYSSTSLEAAPNQFIMKTADVTSYTNTWQNNLCDRLSLVTTANSMLAWYFVVEPGSLSNYNLVSGYNKTENDVNYTIRTVSNVITVDGADNFELYTISGQQLNKLQPVRSGLYIVKVDNQSFKVNVR